MPLRELEVVLKANIAQYEAKLGAAAARTRAFGAEVGGTLTSIQNKTANTLRSTTAQRLSLAATAGLGLFLRGAQQEARESLRMARQTDAVLRSTGGVANVSAGHVDALANKLSKVSAVDDEVVQGAENVLLTFTKIRNTAGAGNDIFDQATQSALDMSAALGQDLQGSVIQLGKALQDPIRGVTALRRVGVAFDQQQQDQIKTLVQSGKQLEAQKIILKEVNTEFGGSAKAAADPVARLGVAFKNLEESVGLGLAPALSGIANIATKLAEGFSGLPQPVQTTIVALGGLVAVSPMLLRVSDTIGTLRGRLSEAAASGSKFAGALGVLGQAGAYGAAIAGLYAGIQALGKAIDSINAPKLTDVEKALLDLADNGRSATGELNKALHGSVGELKEFIDTFSNPRNLPTGRTLPQMLQQELKDVDKALADMVNNGNADGARRALEAFARAAHVDVKTILPGLNDYSDALVSNSNAARNAAGAAGDNAAEQQKAVRSMDDFGGSVDDATGKTLKGKDAVDQFTSAIDKLYDKVFGAADANRAFEAATDDLTEAIFKNGKNFNDATQEGRANNDALENLAKTSLDLISEQRKLGVTGRDLAAVVAVQRQRFQDAAIAAGVNKDQAKLLGEALITVQSIDPTITFKTEGFSDATLAIQQIIDKVAGLRQQLSLPALGDSTLGLVAGRTRTGAQRNAASGALFADRANGHEAEIAPAGAMRMWAEPETQGEAYIPLANDSRRPRAQRIWVETGARLGVDPAALALAGGSTKHALGSITAGNIRVDLNSPEVRAAIAKMGDAAQAMSSRGGGPAGAAPANVSGAVAIGQRMAAAKGWTGNEWNALYQLWQHESGWRANADNPSSSAYGIPQALPGSKMASAGGDWRSNPATQIRWGLDYIAARYGSPSRAWGAWNSRSPHWYAKGAVVDWDALHKLAEAGFDPEEYKRQQEQIRHDLEELAGSGLSSQQLLTIRKQIHRQEKAGRRALSALVNQGFDPEGIEHMAKADKEIRDTERRMRALGIAFDKIAPSGFFTTKPRHGESRTDQVSRAEKALIRTNIRSTTESDKILERFQKSAARNLGGSDDVFADVASLRKMSFDRGGYLPPGYTLAYNGTGRPERVTNHSDSSVHVEVPITVNGGATPETARRLENAGRSIASDIVRALERGRA